MKKSLSFFLGVGLFVLGFFGLMVVNGEIESEAQTRTNVHTIDGKTLQSSVLELQKEAPAQSKNSEIEMKFKDESYSFSLGLQLFDFKNNVAYKDEQSTKDHLRLAMNYLNDLTMNGTDFSAAARLQNDSEWTEFVEDIASLKYNYFSKSEVLNDLNMAGALILQAERHYDEPSLRYLYEVIFDLDSSINGEADKFNVTRSFGKEEQFQEIYKYLQSKI